MAVSRRAFVRTIGVGAAGAISGAFVAARGREALIGLSGMTEFPESLDALGGLWSSDVIASLRAATPTAIRLDSNENPNGPGAVAIEAIRDAIAEVSRYPFASADALTKAIAESHRLSPENVSVGVGSSEILKMAVFTFTAPSKALVTAAPTFEDPARHAQIVAAPVHAVRVDSALKLDLDGMASKSTGAGLVFFCNPNNPTATVHGAATVSNFVARVLRTSPETTILIDEAYHEYVDDPAYKTAIPLALENPRVIVSRTFSKVYGMAGLRLGYAVGQAATLKAMQRHKLPNATNIMASSAAIATLKDAAHLERERKANREARDFTRRAFESAGYPAGASETNFVMVDIRHDSREFQAACRQHGVFVGRPFPPLTTHARVTLGTMDEMRQAVDVFRKVLKSPSSSASRH